MNIVLIGKSATGKSTIATILTDNFRYEMASNLNELTKGSNKVAIVSAQNLLKLKHNKVPMKSFLITSTDKDRFVRQLDNGDDIMDIAIQNQIDTFEMFNVEKEVDYIVSNNTDNVWNVVDKILEIMAK